ncbi:MAG: leucine--tRNA ligase [Chloroflexi bacterium]|nr:leucine--tRNA ligase [Chloroflexota bacterium]MCC6892807.1 leucine--tRNA ligase [Anaerolineae bacterium]
MTETAKYNPQAIEGKWQEQWEADKLYRSTVDWSKPKHYALTMLPYPSGDLHIGHWFAMTPSDARARYMRMRGFNVLFPMGFDAFGLPAENAAVQRNIHPKKWTLANIERMRKQMKSMGAMFDWEREMVSCEPEYYKWTEWFFKQFYEAGLAYRSEAMVNWSPTLQTVLANEQVIDGKDERTGQPVIQKLMTQWFFRYTRYTDEMLNFDNVDWPEPIRIMQTNWIGRSEGARVIFKTEQGDPLEVYTTRPDTLWGATFMVLAPEHALVEKITTSEQREAVEAYRAQAARSTEIERSAEGREKTGVFTGAYAINPVNDARIPIWIADYVMVTYGTGAIMAVPSGDQRDFDFARKFGLEIIPVVQPEGEHFDGKTMEQAYDGAGIMINSGVLNGLVSNGQKGRKNPAVDAAISLLEERGIGKESINYRLRDWLISRQRYWGSPIPMVEKQDGTFEPVPDSQLPVLLPDDVDFLPTGQSPLKLHEGFQNTVDSTGKPAKRETDTMDTFMCSSWYWYRYLSPHYNNGPFDPEEAAYWLPVDVYTGGAEHATMHLLYARWFAKAMRDLGMFEETMDIMKAHGRDPESMSWGEPMLKLRNQGQVLGEERAGHFIIASGTWQATKLFADKVEVIDPADAPAKRSKLVVGEIIKRTENLLTVDVGDGELRTVEVVPDAVVTIPGMEGVGRPDQLKHHLEIQRMSKSKGNVVNPDEWVGRYGSDSVRAYMMFGFDWQKGGPWDSKGIQGAVRWVNDVWDIVTGYEPPATGNAEAERDIERKVHQTIKRVADGLENFSFNGSIAGLMKFRNDLKDVMKAGNVGAAAWREAIKNMLLLMAPFTPHIAEELWAQQGHGYSVHQQLWPEYDQAKAAEDMVTLVIQINGKVRDRIDVPAGISEADANAAAMNSEAVQKALNGGSPKKVIFIAARNGQEPKINVVV